MDAFNLSAQYVHVVEFLRYWPILNVESTALIVRAVRGTGYLKYAKRKHINVRKKKELAWKYSSPFSFHVYKGINSSCLSPEFGPMLTKPPNHTYCMAYAPYLITSFVNDSKITVKHIPSTIGVWMSIFHGIQIFSPTTAKLPYLKCSPYLANKSLLNRDHFLQQFLAL